METGDPMSPRLQKRKVMADEDRLMGFGHYHMNTYGEVMRYNPEYAKYLIKEGKEIIRKPDSPNG